MNALLRELLAFTCVLPLLMGCRVNHSPDLQKVRMMFERELPAGTSEATVSAFLQAKKIEYSVKESSYQGIIRETSGSNSLVTYNIRVTIRIDERKKVKTIEVEQVNTGP